MLTRLVLRAGCVTDKGCIAVVNMTTGVVEPEGPNSTGPDLLRVGYFAESMSGDGAATVAVQAFDAPDVGHSVGHSDESCASEGEKTE